MAGLTNDEARTIAEEAATKALSSFFRYFDVDLDDHESLKAFRTDLEYLRSQREGTEAIRTRIKQSAFTVLGTAVAGALYWLWTIFKGGFIDWFHSLN